MFVQNYMHCNVHNVLAIV